MRKIGHGKICHQLWPSQEFMCSNPKILIEVKNVNFHKTSITQPPFHKIDNTKDNINQSLPNGVLQIQPELGSLPPSSHSS